MHADDNHVQAHGYDIVLTDRTDDAAHHGELRAWLDRAIEADSETTGGAAWPIEVVAVAGGGGAVTNGRRITLRLPAGPRPPTGDEWVLHHELIHASFASLPEEDRWLEEGLATYLEPFVRVRVGQATARDVWHDIARDLPQGAPHVNEGPLRGTWTWHRLYWQGALFWLASDLAIARATAGARSLHDALCAWAKASDVDTPERAFAVMDAALGAPVLAPRFERASNAGVEDEPARVLAALGVTLRGDDVVFDDAAPFASVRRRLTERGRCVR